jgi:integrase
MARKRTTRREHGQGSYSYDKKAKRHEWTIEKDGRRYRVRDKDETAARVRFEELKRRLSAGADVQGARSKLRDYLPRWIDTEVAARTRESTVQDKHKRADLYILPTLGEYAIGDLTREMIVAWVDAMMNIPKDDGSYWARSSIKQALGILRQCLDTAVPKYLAYNPAAGVKVPMRRRRDEYKIDAAPVAAKVFTPEQMILFLAEVQRTHRHHGLYVYYVLLSELGPRRGEGLGLRRKDIDFDHKTIRIAQQVIRDPVTNKTAITIPKTEAGIRELPISDDLVTLLREQCMNVGAQRPDALVFPGEDGAQRQPNSVTQHFRRVCKRLGLEGFTLHSLRKYAVTDWRAAGIDLEVAAALAGHRASGVTADVYSVPTMERKRAAVERRRKIWD